MLYKLESTYSVERFCGWWKVGDTIVTNADAEEYALASGEWFPLVEDEQPEYDHEKQYLAYHYEQEETAIRKVWDIVDIPDEASAEDYENALAEMGVDFGD